MRKSVNGKFVNKKLIVTCVSVLVMLILLFSSFGKSSSNGGSKSNRFSVVEDQDIVIQVSDVSETASFYPAKINGTDVEVVAVKASDGTIRTAFNTCQVCFSSGRGYYVQDGDALVCQNCGNRFAMEDVEVTRGGCNPVPITSDYKTVDSEKITISKEFLAEATFIFRNWKY